MVNDMGAGVPFRAGVFDGVIRSHHHQLHSITLTTMPVQCVCAAVAVQPGQALTQPATASLALLHHPLCQHGVSVHHITSHRITSQHTIVSRCTCRVPVLSRDTRPNGAHHYLCYEGWLPRRHRCRLPQLHQGQKVCVLTLHGRRALRKLLEYFCVSLRAWQVRCPRARLAMRMTTTTQSTHPTWAASTTVDAVRVCCDANRRNVMCADRAMKVSIKSREWIQAKKERRRKQIGTSCADKNIFTPSRV